MVLTIGNISVKRGELKLGRLNCGYLADSSDVSIPLLVANGLESGPRLLLTAAMHGTELTGIEVIRRLMRETIDPGKLRGSVIAAPIANPFAFRNASMLTPQDGYNLNRVFPGDAKTLLSHRLAHLITTELVANSDYLIDFHSNPFPAIPFSIIKECPDQEVWRRCREMASAFGMTTVEMVSSYERYRSGTLSESAARDRKPTLIVELLYWRKINELSVRSGLKGTLNVMKSLKMIDGETEEQSGFPIFEGRFTRTEITADKGGLIHYMKDVGDPVEQGEVFANIRDPWGDVVEEVKSPCKGWVLAYGITEYQAVSTGKIMVMILFPKD